MCEWLSCEEWCDVRLLCGGRALGAHRAVLASVSSFLRRLLLSCPIEDSPTLIVLPDFDLEAMSAVLYYIYNGEVAIPNRKLEKFLDIVKAMQIFIDRQYLTQLCVGEIDCNLNKTTQDHIFVLQVENDDKPLITLKKRLQHNSRSNVRDGTDSYFMQVSPWNRNEQFKPCFGNLQSSQGDRQRDYFLRGSFMETYPRNRNANGRTGVPAISSGSYRAPTSLLLTNANANGHLNSGDASRPPEEAADTACPSNFKLSTYNHADNSGSTGPRRVALPTANLTEVWKRSPLVSMSPLESWQRGSDGKHISNLDLSIMEKSTDMHSLSKDRIQADQRSQFPGVVKSFNRQLNSRDTSYTYNKVAILNKALDNPWCPRLPSSYRPFRRKCHNINLQRDKNDSNNNVKDERALEPVDLQDSGHFAGRAISEKEDLNKQVLPTETASSRPSRYACTECGKTFSQLRNFKYHMSVHRGTKEFAASCTICGKCFNDKGYLSSHMKIHRNRKEYKCSQCPKSFNQRVAYNMHVRIHTGVKPHVCGQCGKAFSRKMLLKQHQRTHSGERPYACPHCDKRFADRSNMTLHLRLHTGIKPFKCPMCPKSFTKKHHLKSHVNFHTGAKPYSCPRCKLAFTQSSNMRTHLKRCTAPEPASNDTSQAS